MRGRYSDTLRARSETKTHFTFLFPPKNDWAQGLYLLNASYALGAITPQVRRCGSKNRAGSQTDTGCEWHFHFRGTGRCLWDRSFVTEASHIRILMISCNSFKKFNKSFQNEEGQSCYWHHHQTFWLHSLWVRGLTTYKPFVSWVTNI